MVTQNYEAGLGGQYVWVPLLLDLQALLRTTFAVDSKDFLSRENSMAHTPLMGRIPWSTHIHKDSLYLGFNMKTIALGTSQDAK